MNVDLEELVGPGCYEFTRRVGGAFSCLWLGSLSGVAGVLVGTTVSELVKGTALAEALPTPELGMLLGGPIPLLATVAGFGVIPLLLATYFLFVRNDAGSPRSWLVLSALAGLLWLLAFVSEVSSPWSSTDILTLGVACLVWLGINGAFALGGFFLINHQRQALGSHLMRIGMQNEDRRARLRARREAARAKLQNEQVSGERD